MPIDDLARDLEVLVVDDEAGIRELLVGYFRTRGFRVAGAHDGRAAITTLQRAEGRFGLVVTDLNLPGADGFAVLQAARQANPSCFVVIITGYASLDSAIRAVRVGAHDYLTKPFAMGQLDVVLSRIQDEHVRGRARSGGPTVRVESAPEMGRSWQAPLEPVAAARPVRGNVAPCGPAAATGAVDGEVVDGEIVSSDRATAAAQRQRASAGVDERLQQLEAAFGRIETLLRQRLS